MPYLVSNDTADWIRRQKTAPGDMRARPRLARPATDSPGCGRPVLAASSTAGDPSAGIPVAIYGNGPRTAQTGVGTAYLPECVAGSAVPPGMWLVCWPGLVHETGGSES